MREYRPERFVFEASRGKPFHRRWPLETLQRICPKAGLTADIIPRVFRRTGATNWKGDPKDLQLQGGWKDIKTVYVYRQAQDDRHYDAFERTFEPKKPDTPEEDPAFR